MFYELTTKFASHILRFNLQRVLCT